jgi:hypothetical protein
MDMGSTIWPATYGSGAATGTTLDYYKNKSAHSTDPERFLQKVSIPQNR